MNVKRLNVSGNFKDGYTIEDSKSLYNAPISKNRHDLLLKEKMFAMNELHTILKLQGYIDHLNYDTSTIVDIDVNGSNYGYSLYGHIYDIVFMDSSEKPIFAIDLWKFN